MKLCLEFITFDPNYNYEDDDGEDEANMDADDDDEECVWPSTFPRQGHVPRESHVLWLLL